MYKFYFQSFKNFPIRFPVADEFGVRYFWKSEDWQYKEKKKKKGASICSNLTSESNTSQKCLLSAVMQLFLETRIVTKGCSLSQQCPAWGYACSTFPRYVSSSGSYICFRSNLAGANSNKNERRTAQSACRYWDLGYFLGLLL